MKKTDFIVIILVVLILSPFFLFNDVYQGYTNYNSAHPFIMAFIKFAILATFGEMLGLRLKTGNYTAKGYGLLPRCIVWGLLGMWIALAMGVFSKGIPAYLARFDIFANVQEAMSGGFTTLKLCGAFFISLMMNTAFAPIFMTLHKITDTHILNNGGRLSSLTKPIPVGKIISEMNWNIQWNFVFKKTIPFFWIPAHTLTFLLPTNLQVLFAAFCGIILGLILSIAAKK
jgi:Mpv17 / PMP22 family.